MKNDYLIIIDMQRDFVDGALGTEEAQKIVPAIVKTAENFNGRLIFTADTHANDYLSTREGKLLPVSHCIKGTEGWQLIPELEKIKVERNAKLYEKPTFGCTALAKDLIEENKKDPINSIYIAGLCTDICVISNALLIKASLPEVPIFVLKDCCAGVSPEKHRAALSVMESCHIIPKESKEL